MTIISSQACGYDSSFIWGWETVVVRLSEGSGYDSYLRGVAMTILLSEAMTILLSECVAMIVLLSEDWLCQFFYMRGVAENSCPDPLPNIRFHFCFCWLKLLVVLRVVFALKKFYFLYKVFEIFFSPFTATKISKSKESQTVEEYQTLWIMKETTTCVSLRYFYTCLYHFISLCCFLFFSL